MIKLYYTVIPTCICNIFVILIVGISSRYVKIVLSHRVSIDYLHNRSNKSGKETENVAFDIDVRKKTLLYLSMLKDRVGR